MNYNKNFNACTVFHTRYCEVMIHKNVLSAIILFGAKSFSVTQYEISNGEVCSLQLDTQHLFYKETHTHQY